MPWDLKTIGIPETIRAVQQYSQQLRPVTMEGLVAGVNEVIKQARINLYAAPSREAATLMLLRGQVYQRTGRLGNSLRILSQREEGSQIIVEAGSDLDYAFYQEYGWTSRAGNQIPGKLYFTRANELMRPRIAELLASTIKAKMRLEV